MSRVHHILSVGFTWLTIALFVGALWVPGVMMGLRGDRDQSPLERRALAVRPAWPETLEAWEALPENTSQWVMDQAGFRRRLVRLRSSLMRGLGQSPSPKVLLGREGWLFLTLPPSIASFRRTHPFSPEQLARVYDTRVAVAQKLRDAGVPYVLAMVPNKVEVYADKVPARMLRLEGPTRIQQLMEYNRAHANFPMVDLTSTLLEARAEGDVYHKTDTHWNLRGARAAHRPILEALALQIEGLEPVEDDPALFTTADTSKLGGALSRMIGNWQLSERDYPTFRGAESICTRKQLSMIGFSRQGACASLLEGCRRRPVRSPVAIRETDWMKSASSFSVRCDGAPHSGTLVVLRDSFGTEIQPFLARYFEKTIFLWTVSNPDTIAAVLQKFQPAALLDLQLERHLLWSHSEFPEEESDEP